MILIKLAIRNLFRHKVRTLVNLSMMIGGFCGVVLFLGFSNDVLLLIEDSYVKSIYGHIQIGKQDLWDRTPLDDEKDRLIEKPELVIEQILKNPNVQYASDRLTFFGLLTLNQKTTSGQGWGLNSAVELEFVKKLPIVEGRSFSNKSDYEILLSSGLQKQLQAKIGDTITIVTQTFDGMANAIDPTLVGVFNTGIQEVDSVTFMVPLKATKKLLDTERSEKILVLLKKKMDLDPVKKDIQQLISTNKDLTTKNWTELSSLYIQTVEYFNLQNNVIMVILSVLIFLGIINTISMSIFERTQEIGTFRALGDSKKDILKLFLLEGFFLFIISVIIAVPLAHFLSISVSSMNIMINLPGASQLFPLGIVSYPGAHYEAALILAVATFFAVYLPAKRASYLSIVEALRK